MMKPIMLQEKAMHYIYEHRFALMMLTAIAMLFFASQAHADTIGTDTTFASAITLVETWMKGTFGKLIALVAFLVGLVLAIAKGSVMGGLIGIVIGLCMIYGPDAIDAMFSAGIPMQYWSV